MNKMTDEKIIEKIKKLLELAASPNENEARLAYNRAKDLMAKYSVDITAEDTKSKEIVELVYIPDFKSPNSLWDYMPQIALAIVKPFGVFVLMHNWANKNSRKMKFVGFKTNIEVAEHAVDCIVNQCLADFRLKFAEERSMAFAPAFWSGVARALTARFAQSSVNETGLVVYDPVKKFMEKYKPAEFLGANSNAENAARAGFESGNSAQIRSGITTGNQGKLLS